MPKSGPIIIVEDDSDDQEILKEIFDELGIPNVRRFFNSCSKALDYLVSTIERPFIIISDINLPIMSGLDLRLAINQNNNLRKKGIPFVFLSTNPDSIIIAKAYEILAQGYFIKPSSMRDLREMINMIIGYWKVSKHANE